LENIRFLFLIGARYKIKFNLSSKKISFLKIEKKHWIKFINFLYFALIKIDK